MKNIYQECRMSCPIEIHEDVSQAPFVLPLHIHNFYELLFVCGGDLEYLLFPCEDVTRGDLAAMATETIDLGR